MKYRIIFLLFLQLSASSQVMLKVLRDTMLVYNYSGGDEFNEGRLNEAVWKNGLYGRRVAMDQDLVFSPVNVKFEKDLINFVADKHDSVYVLYDWEIDSSFLKKEKITLIENKFRVLYSAGAIVSLEKYHYGIYELRFKVEEGQGVWPAFWFYGGKQNEEIDAFELKGERNNEIHVDTHCPSGCDHGYKKTKFSFGRSYGGWLPVSNYLHSGFNFMVLEWTEEEVIWYINGRPLAYYRGKFSNPMNLYLNTSVAKTGKAFGPGPNETTTWPVNYYVDYFRVWQAQGKDQMAVVSQNKILSYSRRFPSEYETSPLKKNGLLYKKEVQKSLEGLITVSCSNKNTLTITCLGAILDHKTKISIKGKNTNKVVDVTDKELDLEFDLRDSDLILEVNTGTKVFMQNLHIE